MSLLPPSSTQPFKPTGRGLSRAMSSGRSASRNRVSAEGAPHPGAGMGGQSPTSAPPADWIASQRSGFRPNNVMQSVERPNQQRGRSLEELRSTLHSLSAGPPDPSSSVASALRRSAGRPRRTSAGSPPHPSLSMRQSASLAGNGRPSPTRAVAGADPSLVRDLPSSAPVLETLRPPPRGLRAVPSGEQRYTAFMRRALSKEGASKWGDVWAEEALRTHADDPMRHIGIKATFYARDRPARLDSDDTSDSDADSGGPGSHALEAGPVRQSAAERVRGEAGEWSRARAPRPTLVAWETQSDSDTDGECSPLPWASRARQGPSESDRHPGGATMGQERGQTRGDGGGGGIAERNAGHQREGRRRWGVARDSRGGTLVCRGGVLTVSRTRRGWEERADARGGTRTWQSDLRRYRGTEKGESDSRAGAIHAMHCGLSVSPFVPRAPCSN